MKKRLLAVLLFAVGCATDPQVPDPAPDSYVPYSITCGKACPATHSYQSLPKCKAAGWAADHTLDCPKLVTDCYCVRKREENPLTPIKL